MSAPLSSDNGHSPATAELAQELTAYLDGELSPEASRAVEQRLASDPQARAELRRLERVWDALEHLPRQPTTEDFARSTLEMVALNAEAAAKPRLAWSRLGVWGRIALGGLLGVLTVGLLVGGFALGRQMFPNPNRPFLADLPILLRMEEYRAVGTLEYLEQLDKLGVFDPVPSDEVQAGFGLAGLSRSVADPAVTSQHLGDRRNLVLTFTPQQQEEVGRRWDWFDQNESERNALRRLHDALQEHPRGDELWRVALVYNRWLQQLSHSARVGLAERPANERIREVAQRRGVEVRSERAAAALSDADRRAIMAWGIEVIREAARMPDRERIIERLEGSDLNSPAQVGSLMWLLGRGPLAPHWLRRLPEETQEKLLTSLTADTRARLNQEAASREDRLALLTRWLWASSRQQLQTFRTRPNPDQLQEYFLTLDRTVQRDLEGLPPEQFQSVLAEMYYADRFGPMGPFGQPGRVRERRGEWRPGDGPVGPPGPMGPMGPNREGRDRDNRDRDTDADGSGREGRDRAGPGRGPGGRRG